MCDLPFSSINTVVIPDQVICLIQYNILSDLLPVLFKLKS